MSTWRPGDSMPDILRKILEALTGGINISNVTFAIADGPRFGGYSVIVESPALVDTGAYAAGDVVGGLRELSVCRVPNAGTVLQSVSVIDHAAQEAAMTLIFFNSNPTASTVADQAAFALAAADVSKVIGLVEVAAADYVDLDGTTSVAQLNGIGLVLQPAGAVNTIYCVAVTSGTPTYAATGDLQLKLGLLQD